MDSILNTSGHCVQEISGYVCERLHCSTLQMFGQYQTGALNGPYLAYWLSPPLYKCCLKSLRIVYFFCTNMTQNIIRFSHKSWKWTQSAKWDKNVFLVIYLFSKMIQYCISVSGKSMDSSSFKGDEIRVSFSQCNDHQMSVRWPVFIQRTRIYQSLIMFVEVNHEQSRLLRTSEKSRCCSSC